MNGSLCLKFLKCFLRQRGRGVDGHLRWKFAMLARGYGQYWGHIALSSGIDDLVRTM